MSAMSSGDTPSLMAVEMNVRRATCVPRMALSKPGVELPKKLKCKVAALWQEMASLQPSTH